MSQQAMHLSVLLKLSPKDSRKKPLNEVYKVSHTGKFHGVGTLGAYVQTQRACVKCK